MKTLFDYLIEGKIDTEYEKAYSDIPRETFEAIVRLDPKSALAGNELQGIGFVAKKLLLPAYQNGETDLVNIDGLKDLIITYYQNLNKYPKPQEFKSVSDFVQFMKNPEGEIELNIQAKEDPISRIYNKYYNKIPREIFDNIIKVDPQTTDTQIGEIARNLLLPRYLAGETDFVQDLDNVQQAIDRFISENALYAKDKQSIGGFKSVEEFVEYHPESPITREVPHLQEHQDYEIIASGDIYDFIRVLTWPGSRDLAHTNGARNVWCTAGGSDGARYLNSDNVSSYWLTYTRDRNNTIYEILNKLNPTDLKDNYNLAVKSDGTVAEFRNGNNEAAGNFSSYFQSVIGKDPKLVKQLALTTDNPLSGNTDIQQVADLLKYYNEPLIIDSYDRLQKVIDNYNSYKNIIKDIQIKNIKIIPANMFANFIRLETAIISGPKVIGGAAFKNCANLTTLTLEEPLEKISDQAFSGCIKLRGSIRVPDSLIEVGLKAFDGTHCRLKIDENRQTSISFDYADRNWVTSHVQSIKAD